MKSQKLLILVLSTVTAALLFSCATNAQTQTEENIVNEYETPIDFSAYGYTDFLKTPPYNGKPVFFASVKRMSDREDEKAAALIKAAQQASKFKAVKAASRFYTEKLNSTSRHLHDLEIEWDRELAIDLIDSLEVLQISRDTYGTYLTAMLPGTLMPPATVSAPSSQAPSWTNRIPVIPGYIVSVGIALQTGYVADSFEAADNQALEDLARQISVQITSGKKLIQNNVGTAELTTNLEEAEVVIPGFYILERWRSPDARYYYSLAIAPEDIIEKYKDD